MAWIAALTLSLITFLIRFWPRVRLLKYGDDTWFHLLIADVYRKEKALPRKYPHFIPPSDSDYPPGFSMLLSLLNKQWLDRWERYLAPAMEGVTSAAIFGFAFWLTHSLWVASFAALLYALTPAVAFQAASLNPRLVGYFLHLLTGLCLVWGGNEFHWAVFGIVILLGALILYTHKMTAQAWIALVLGYALLQGVWAYVWGIPLALILACGLSKGHYLKVLRGHIKLVRMHLRSLLDPAMQVYSADTRKQALIKGGIWAGLLLFFSAAIPDKSPALWALFAWAWSLFAAFALTSFVRPLRCLGEGYRYLEYGMAPWVILWGISLLQPGPFRLILGAAAILYIGLGWIQIRRNCEVHRNHYPNIVDEDRMTVYQFMNGLAKEGGVLCCPSGMSYATAYFTRFQVLWMPNSGWEQVPWLFPQITPNPSLPFSGIVSQYGIRYILHHQNFCKPAQLKLTNAEVLIHKGPYRLLKV
ncbi:MAG: hypothetical protein JW937_01800 [Candidatus Omnitrophica bacterium]|nr:hypothetical protein [Candidatus Omnitrophota bacterium]